MGSLRGKLNGNTVLNNAEILFRQKGYSNTSMSDIGTKSGILKGSLYHYFPSKEDICMNIIQRVANVFRNEILCHAYDKTHSKNECLNLVMTETQNYMLLKRGCFMAHLGLETAFNNEKLSHEIQQFFTEWTSAIAHTLQDRYGADKSMQLAKDTVSKVEGAVMFLTICNDAGPLERITAEAIDLLKD